MSKQAQVTVRTLATEGSDPVRAERYAGLLDSEERARADRFVFERDRRDFVAAHGLMRELLGRLLGTDPARLRFAADQIGGKPRLADPFVAGLDANLSHTHGFVACAVATAGIIGIDVEATDRAVDLAIADRYFAGEEIAWLRAQADPNRAFLKLWTLKEAIIKADGSGLALDLTSFAVQPGSARPLSLPAALGPIRAWHLRVWQPTDRHIAALSHRTPDGAVALVDLVDLREGVAG
jgi:4'-phosphopantetheinyl transferase